jgi:hypothetical protein
MRGRHGLHALLCARVSLQRRQVGLPAGNSAAQAPNPKFLPIASRGAVPRNLFDCAAMAHMTDHVRLLNDVLDEADRLIRRRIDERSDVPLPHLVIAVTPGGQIILRSNVNPDALRSLGEDLKKLADEIEAGPEPGDTTH